MAIMLKFRLDRFMCKLGGHRWAYESNGSGKDIRRCKKCGKGQWRYIRLDWYDE